MSGPVDVLAVLDARINSLECDGAYKAASELRTARAAVAELIEALDGIVHFSDGFAMYHTDSPAGHALRDWINGAETALANIGGAS